MRIVHAAGVDGARRALGVVVIIDVLRAFTVSAYALARGARECRLTTEVDEALRLAAQIPGSLISAEVDGLPIAGIPISNSPTQITQTDLEGITLIQRTSAGTQCVGAAVEADRVLAASLVVAAATARHVAALGAGTVTLVASRPDHAEDPACAAYLEALLEGGHPDPARLLRPLRRTKRYRGLAAGETPGFPPTDLGLCLVADRFDFAMPVARDALGLRLTAAAT